jgi:dTDP-4-amino-4,6-dideoxygalactose transaminase
MADDTQFSPWPFYEQDEIDAVSDVLSSGRVNYWTGDNGKEFEHEFARHFGAEYAIALANGTVALDIALKALDIGSGDEVIVTPMTQCGRDAGFCRCRSRLSEHNPDIR